MKKKIMSILLAISMMLVLPCQGIKADSYDESDIPYLSLGADLTSSQKDKVLQLLGVDKNELDSYRVVEVTNKDEHEYLGNYLSDSVIGRKALSSVKIQKAEKGDGITVTTHNINYCTATMYCNALVTAGMEDADVVVAGPFELTGTAALVGTIKAYSSMTGEEVTKESIDAATNELVLTGELGDDIADELGGDEEEAREKAGELMALVKQKVVEEKLSSAPEIKEAVTEACTELEISVSDENKEKIAKLMGKISKLDLNVDKIKKQAKDLYDKLANMDVDTDGILEKIGGFFGNIFDRIAGFFKSLFGNE